MTDSDRPTSTRNETELTALGDEPVLEPIIEPDLPIVDAHHHLWYVSEATIDAMERDETISARGLAPMYRSSARYLFDELMDDMRGGHNVRTSIYVEAQSMYRADGPREMRSVGEVEFANGVAAMGASGLWGEQRPCAGIVGTVDLTLGDSVEAILVAHIQAGGGRYRGVRPRTYARRRPGHPSRRHTALAARLRIPPGSGGARQARSVPRCPCHGAAAS